MEGPKNLRVPRHRNCKDELGGLSVPEGQTALVSISSVFGVLWLWYIKKTRTEELKSR